MIVLAREMSETQVSEADLMIVLRDAEIRRKRSQRSSIVSVDTSDFFCYIFLYRDIFARSPRRDDDT